MTGRPLPATQRGTVLAVVKATPCGWPAASLDPSCGRHLRTAVDTGPDERGTKPRSVNQRSPRFRGMASRAHRMFANARWSSDAVGLVLADLIVARLLPADSAITIAVDDTLFKRSGKK